MTWGIFKKDSVSDTVAKIQAEALKGDQHKLDKNKNGKVDKHDFKLLRKEETDLAEEATHTVDIDHMGGHDEVAKKHNITLTKTNKTGYSHDATGTKKNLQKYLAHHYDSHEDAKEMHPEVFKEGWDDMLKYVKDKNGPQPNGGSGKKQGTRYGGQKQKEDESEKRKEKNESVEQIDELSTDKLKAYKSAAQDDRAGYHDSKSSGDKEEAEYAKKKIMKRSSGIVDANKRLNKANESVEDANESTVDEEVQKDIVKMGAKEIKHANVKDKQNDQDVMEPHSKGEADFLDQHSIEVTDDPARDGHKTGADKLSAAAQPRGQGAGKYDGKNKTGVKESTSEDDIIEENIDEACGGSKAKKTYSSFKAKIDKKGN